MNNHGKLFQKYLHSTQTIELGPRHRAVHHHSMRHKSLKKKITVSPTHSSASLLLVSGGSDFCCIKVMV